MWRSVLLHEFPGRSIREFQSIGGAATAASQALTLEPDASSRRFVLPLLAGQLFEFVPAVPLRQIVGVSMRVRLTGSVAGFVSTALFRLSAGVELDLLIRRPVFGPSKPTDAAVRVGGAGAAFASSVPALGRPVDVRLDWHTSGQARLWADGRLVGYHNALAPGSVLEIDRVAFGLPGPQPEEFDRLARRFTVRRVFVRALARPDTMAAVVRALPKSEPTVDDLLIKCRFIARDNVLATVDRLRAFMALAHQTLTQPWSAPDGPASGPFQPAAVEAHALATAAGAAFSDFLRRPDSADAASFLDPFEAFLRILHDTLPAQFASLAADLRDRPVVPDECRLVMEKALDPLRGEFAPLIDLLTAASDRVRAIAEGA
ncbi:hypothetical protein [Microbacterium ulmi]|uniref:Uncharacterized protein n=1 Tax=Microbacterium ulmi TaxID=179095 RepID=A0A7Y2PZI4_9MICO|nr:hypothetical protein [Microbacterium ulmi]NII70276.1 hypothetical protein [Microbacterium ulmi]NNH03323.1 hypothetical protein [Microbacterium ulmi]